eukprot:GILI01027367.1.p1 GENE.GILI01027367.1~~GILI01027367.1.p1  ORF type:complete len:213 (-),score=47.42 GILI01027367.1:81-719(-)
MGSSGSKAASGTVPNLGAPQESKLNLKATNDDFIIAESEDPEIVNKVRQELHDAKLAKEKYQNLKSVYLSDAISKSKDGKAPSTNLIEQIQNEDFDMVDHRQSMRIPPMVLKELRNAVDNEAMRRCAPDEKIMAQCLQDKMWTAWKCQKERDSYYMCMRKVKDDNDLLTDLRWKYNVGTFHGEIVARKAIMQRLWREHYPDREIPHGWASEE